MSAEQNNQLMFDLASGSRHKQISPGRAIETIRTCSRSKTDTSGVEFACEKLILEKLVKTEIKVRRPKAMQL